VGWALAIVAVPLFFRFGEWYLNLAYENRLRKVLTRRGMSIVSLDLRVGFRQRVCVFEAIFITPRGRRIQGIFRVGNQWSGLPVRFQGRSDRPAHVGEEPKTSFENRKVPRTLFEITKEPKTALERWFG
jgi:hypothetical protein